MRLHQLAEGVWTLDGDPISFLTFPYEIRSTIIDLADGELLLHSPVQISTASVIKTLPGQVKHIVSPNKLHSLYLEEWQKEFPLARFYAPPGLIAKLPEVSFYKELTDQPEAVWQNTLKQKVVRGSWFMSEVVFFHISSGTLILGDLVENHNPRTLNWPYRVIAKANAMVAPNGTTARIFRWTFIRRKETRQAFQEILHWEIKRVIPNHGPIVNDKAIDFLTNAFQWTL